MNWHFHLRALRTFLKLVLVYSGELVHSPACTSHPSRHWFGLFQRIGTFTFVRSAPFAFFVHSSAANAALRRRPSAATLFDQWDNNHSSSSWAFAVHHLAASGVPGSREIRGADRAGISGTHGRISGACELPFRGRFAEIRQLDSRLGES